MYSIASLLDARSGQAVQSLWEHFEENCGLTGIKFSALPHFSWMGADMFQVEPVEAILHDLSAEIQPFPARASSLGVFPGRMPVVYLGLVKNENLMRIHQTLWERIRPYAIQPNEYYDPENWMPHITLALYDVVPDRLGCAVSSIAFEQIDINLVIDNFAVLYYTDGKAGMKSRFGFRNAYQLMEGNG
jgi:2'-5' RNA ligase